MRNCIYSCQSFMGGFENIIQSSDSFPNFASAVLNKFLAWQQTDYVLCFVLRLEAFSFEKPSLKRNRNWQEQGY